jgi:hypothetical protein
MSNRLQYVILEIVHENQYGFIKGETILDGLLNIYISAIIPEERLLSSSWTLRKLLI